MLFIVSQNIARIANAVQVITSARGTVIAAEVAVKNMYHEEPELLPAASGTNTEKGAPPTVGGMRSPFRMEWADPIGSPPKGKILNSFLSQINL